MGKVLRKLQSNNGATLMLALLFFIVCAVTGSMILTSAGVSAGRLENMKRRDQNYFAVRSAIKMCEQQIRDMNVAFTDQLVVTEVEVDSDDDDDDDDIDSSDSSPNETRVYSIKYEQFDDEEKYPICAWIKDELVSNYQEKVKAAKENKDAFDLKWFKGVVQNGSTEDATTLKVHQSVNFSAQADGASEELKKQLDNLNVEIDVELTSVGVMTYKIYNAETIDGKPNKDKYIMTLTVDIDVPCKRSVDVEVDVEETGEGENKKTKTTTITTYTNEYTFDFRIRDIKKG